MPHATHFARRFWVGLFAIALISACAPNHPRAQKAELKTGQEVSQAASKSTQESDIDALVLSSSSMDDEADEADEAEDEDAPVEEIEATPPSAPDAGRSDAEDTHGEDAHEDTDTTGAPE